MIIAVYALLLAFALVLLLAGFLIHDQVMQVVGFIFLILCAFVLTGLFGFSGIEYASGSSTTTTHTYTNTSLLNVTTATETAVLTAYSNSIYGTMLLFAAVFGLVFAIAGLRRQDT